MHCISAMQYRRIAFSDNVMRRIILVDMQSY
jgi:hypothetical protein